MSDGCYQEGSRAEQSLNCSVCILRRRHAPRLLPYQRPAQARSQHTSDRDSSSNSMRKMTFLHVKDILGRKRRMLKIAIMGNWSFSDFFFIQDFTLKKKFLQDIYLSVKLKFSLYSLRVKRWVLISIFCLGPDKKQKQKGSPFMPHLTSSVYTPVFAGCKFEFFSQCL